MTWRAISGRPCLHPRRRRLLGHEVARQVLAHQVRQVELLLPRGLRRRLRLLPAAHQLGELLTPESFRTNPLEPISDEPA